MKNLPSLLLSVLCISLLPSCEKATPEQTFARAVVNSNLMSGFAGNGMRYQLENPSVKMTPSGGSAPMTRKEIVDGEIASIDESYQKTKKLGQTDDNREMIEASIALHEFVLPVYRNEYTNLAALYDSGARRSELEAAYKAITDKYLKDFQEKSELLNAAGKPFAKRHGIRVTWDVRSSPSP